MEPDIRKLRMPPGWRKLGTFSEMAAATADFNEGRGACDGHVYFVGGEEGPIKIGFSANLHARIRALKNSSSAPIRLLAATPGGRDLERDYHDRFAADRQHGEWFVRTPAIIAEIERLSE
jgi:hypothetical protein